MISRLLLSGLLWAWPGLSAAGQSEPEAVKILQSALKAPEVAYDGRLSVLPQGAKKPRRLQVWYFPDGRIRRDLIGPRDSLMRSVIYDGNYVWYYDRIRRAAWKGDPEDADNGYRLIPKKDMDLMARNYNLRLLPKTARVAGRVCRIIEVMTADGRLSRRLWLDREFGLPLEIKSYDADGSISSSMRFIRVEFGAKMDKDIFTFSPPADTEIIPSRRRPNYLDDAQSWRRGHGPVLPRWIPPRYDLESSDIVVHEDVRVIHSRYTDGLEAVSLFQYPEKVRLPAGGATATPIELKTDAHAELSEGGQWPGEPAGTGIRVIQWRLHHQRFVLVGRLPVETLTRMAESLP